MVLAGQIFVFIAYFAPLIKVYLQAESVKWVHLQGLLYGPFLLAYTYQLIKEVLKTDFRPKLKCEPAVYRQHVKTLVKMNAALLLNFLIVSAFSIVFANLLCMRLDGSIELTYFVVLIPVWLLLLYICSYVVLIGLASTNSKVN